MDFELGDFRQPPARTVVALADRKLPLWAGGLGLPRVLESSFLKDGREGQQNALDPS